MNKLLNWQAKIIADSISREGIRLTSLQLKYPRFIHSEFMTHRMFSRNASSSRAIPVSKMLDEIQNNPAIPIYWGKNKPGMQADEECNNNVRECSDGDLTDRKTAWLRAALLASIAANHFDCAGYHKQIVNRITEPFQWISVIVTATEWENFFNLRLDKAAQPEIQHLAHIMREAFHSSIPNLILPGQWHVPYVGEGRAKKKCWQKRNYSAARCARVSYNNHDGTSPNKRKDIDLSTQLLGEGHMSPFEHQATPINPENKVNWRKEIWSDESGITHEDKNGQLWSGNFRGWIQHRQLL